MSLSQEPAFSVLKDNFVCGVRDISRESYAGVSGKHEPDGKAIATSNGAGPHNLQLFMLAPDGTVLHCLPGYWNPKDLVGELAFAESLYDVWRDPSLPRYQKDAMFRQMQLAHVNTHPWPMVARSRMQGFDQKYEAKHRLYTSDTITDPRLIQASYSPEGQLPQQAFKTTDELVHERMARRPFVPYSEFDTARFVDYGRPLYDKHEDSRDESGQIVSRNPNEELIGNKSQMKGQNRRKRTPGGYTGYLMQTGLRTFTRYGVRAALGQ